MYKDVYQKNKTYHNKVEYRPCLFSNGKGGFHIQFVAVSSGRQFVSNK